MFAPAHSMEFLINDDSGSVRAIMSPKAMEVLFSSSRRSSEIGNVR